MNVELFILGVILLIALVIIVSVYYLHRNAVVESVKLKLDPNSRGEDLGYFKFNLNEVYWSVFLMVSVVFFIYTIANHGRNQQETELKYNLQYDQLKSKIISEIRLEDIINHKIIHNDSQIEEQGIHGEVGSQTSETK